MKKLVMSLMLIVSITFVSAGVYAGVTLINKDSKRYYYMANTSKSCFSGGVTSYISSNTTSSVPAGWFCLNKSKPAVKLNDGERWFIKNGKLQKG